MGNPSVHSKNALVKQKDDVELMIFPSQSLRLRESLRPFPGERQDVNPKRPNISIHYKAIQILSRSGSSAICRLDVQLEPVV